MVRWWRTIKSRHSKAVPARKIAPRTIVASHQRMNPLWFPRPSVLSATWTVPLLASRHAVVHTTNDSDSASAGVGPTTSRPRYKM
jgi:hypothetical protein